jgi:hypothetical protein
VTPVLDAQADDDWEGGYNRINDHVDRIKADQKTLVKK